MNAFFSWLFRMIAEFLWRKTTDAAKEEIQENNDDRAADANAKDLEERSKNGASDDEIKEKSEDLLNGER